MPKLSPETLRIAADTVESHINLKVSEKATTVELAPYFAARSELLAAGAEPSADKPKKPRAPRKRGLPTNEEQIPA